MARWTLTLDHPLPVPPAYDAATAYLQFDSKQLAAYDLTNGQSRWESAVQPLAPPVVGDDLLFLEQPDEIVALRKSDGAVAWTSRLSSRLSAPLAWSSGRLIAASDASVLALRSADGSPIWRREIAGPVHEAPAVTADRVFVPTSDGRVLALRAATGTTVWERRLRSTAHGLRAANERLFLGAVDNFFYCLNAENGQTEWTWRTGADVVNVPLLDESRVYFVSLDNVVRALNQRNGVQQWKRGLMFRPAFGPIRAADTLVLTGVDGPLRAFFLKDGQPAGEMGLDPGSEIIWPLHSFQSPGSFGPTVFVAARLLAPVGPVTRVIVGSRSVDPVVTPTLSPLPGLIPMTAQRAR